MTTAPLPLRAIVIGHLTITTPAIGAILLVPFLGLPMFGPHLFVYYVLAGLAAAWQWHSLALRGWEEWLVRKAVQGSEEEHFARRAGLVWPGESVIGPFALHTTAAAVCGIHLGPWLLSRWFVWILPLAGMSTGAPTGTDYFRHFELASIVPALVVGYLLSQYVPRLGTLAWFVPTVILVYKLLTFTEPYASILSPHSSTRFAYFFDIQRSIPSFTSFAAGLGDGDPIRFVEQMFVVAPFYAGLAYSVGALGGSHDLLKKLFKPSPMPSDREIAQLQETPKECTENEVEKVAHELD